MRIATHQLFQHNLRAITDLQTALARTQLRIASGKENLHPADDPIAAVRSLDIREFQGRTERFTRNIERATSALETEEVVLDSVVNVLQRVRELAVRGNNDGLSDVDRRAIADEVAQHLEELLSLANAKDPQDNYLFAGFQSATRPFSANTMGGFDYHGDQGRRFLRISDEHQLAVTDSGADVFRDIHDGNGVFATDAAGGNSGSGVIDPGSVIDASAYVPDDYTINFTTPNSYEVRDGLGGLVTTGVYTDGSAIAFAGLEVRITGGPVTNDVFTVSPSANQDLFSTLFGLVNALDTTVSNDADLARVHQGLVKALSNLDQGLNNILQIQASVGARMNSASLEKELHESSQLLLTESLRDIEEVDLAEAISLLERQAFVLEAAQASFVRINGLSLFNLL